MRILASVILLGTAHAGQFSWASSSECYSMDVRYYGPCSKIALQAKCEEQFVCIWGNPWRCVAKEGINEFQNKCMQLMSEQDCIAQMACSWVKESPPTHRHEFEHWETTPAHIQSPVVQVQLDSTGTSATFWLLLGFAVPFSAYHFSPVGSKEPVCFSVCAGAVFGLMGAVVTGLVVVICSSSFVRIASLILTAFVAINADSDGARDRGSHQSIAG